jgi:hypothetical protein
LREDQKLGQKSQLKLGLNIVKKLGHPAIIMMGQMSHHGINIVR